VGSRRRSAGGCGGTLLHPDGDLILGNYYVGRCVDKTSEDVTGLGRFLAVTDPGPEQPVQSAGDERGLHIAVDLHGHRGGEDADRAIHRNSLPLCDECSTF
jgi:hypothetical protein